MRRIKKFCLSLFIILTAVSLFVISFSAFCRKTAVGGLDAACVTVFLVSAAAFILVFIIDREKQMVFACLYTAAIAIGIFLPLLISRIIK